MRASISVAVALLLSTASVANAAGLSISVGDHSYPLGTTTVVLPIHITGDVQISGTDINAEIARTDFIVGPGNFPAGPSPKVSWQGAPSDVAGNFMSSTPHAFIDVGTDSYNVLLAEALFIPATVSTTTNGGLLINLIVDFTGFNASPGTWRIIMGPLNGNDSTDFSNNNGPVPVTITDGTVSITPEPSSVVLAVIAIAGLAVSSLRHRRDCKP